MSTLEPAPSPGALPPRAVLIAGIVFGDDPPIRLLRINYDAPRGYRRASGQNTPPVYDPLPLATFTSLLLNNRPVPLDAVEAHLEQLAGDGDVTSTGMLDDARRGQTPLLHLDPYQPSWQPVLDWLEYDLPVLALDPLCYPFLPEPILDQLRDYVRSHPPGWDEGTAEWAPRLLVSMLMDAGVSRREAVEMTRELQNGRNPN